MEIKFYRRRYYKVFIFIFIIFYVKEINKIQFLTDYVENSIHNKRKIGNLITHDINLSTLDSGSGSDNPQKSKSSCTSTRPPNVQDENGFFAEADFPDQTCFSQRNVSFTLTETKSFSTKNEKQNSQIINIKDCTVHIHYDK